MDSVTLSRLLTEVANGVPAAESQVPDSAEVRTMRAKLQEEVAAGRKAGNDVEVPSDFDVFEPPPALRHKKKPSD